jgi:7-carboxy-7-deazaguanine synthase
MTKYAMAEVFKTLQGEGLHAGRSAVFVRFAGCNLWTGQDETRGRDADRHGAQCPRFCDTDFKARLSLTAPELVDMIVRFLPASMVVFTGGEPLLQLDRELLERVMHVSPMLHLAVETNGTVTPKDGVKDLLDHVCVSPKLPDEKIVVRNGDELKVVFPRYDPADYEALTAGFHHLVLSPEAETIKVGLSLVQHDVERRAAEWVKANPPWRLSLQLHKHLGIA